MKLPSPENGFSREWNSQNNRIIERELNSLQSSLRIDARGFEVLTATDLQTLMTQIDAALATSGSGDLLAINNLSDLDSVSTARTNLGLGTMATQNATAVAITGGTATLSTLTTGHVQVTGGSFGAGRLYKSASHGTALVASAGSSYDAALFNPAGSAAIWRVPTGTNNVEFTGTLSTTQKTTLSGATSAANATEIRRTVLQYHGLWGDATANWHTSYSDTAAAKPLIVNVTTDASNTAPSGGSLAYQVRIQGSDRLVVNSTGASITGTISASNLAGTTYTPTLRGTVDVNISSSSFQSATYIRVGSAVMATIQLFITPTATGSVQFSVSLPVASNLTSVYQLGGNCAARDTVPITGMVVGSATNDNAVAEFVAATTNIHEVTLQIMYPIL